MPRIRAPFRYSGSNANLVKRLLQFIPETDLIDDWNEVFAGTAVLTLNKPRHALETINDINGEAVNFFEQLRDDRERLIYAIQNTLYARFELDIAYLPSPIPLERARRFYVRQMMSRNGADPKPYWKRQFKSRDANGRKMKPACASFADTDHLDEYAKRLRGVQVENLHVLDYLKGYDHDRALFYLDPPFMPDTRANKDGMYEYEMTEDEHKIMLVAIKNLEGYSFIRHYANEVYDDILKSFTRHDIGKARIDYDDTRIESIYVSPNLQKLLSK